MEDFLLFNKLLNLIENEKKEKTCKFINNSLIFDYENNIRFCPFSNTGEIINNFNGIWLDIEKIKKVKSETIELIKSNENTGICKNCEFYSNQRHSENNKIKFLYLSNWKNCYLNCSYCFFPKEEDLIKAKHYDILPAIKQLLDAKLIDVDTTVIFSCGDATIHPEFDKILYYFINYEMKKIIINTPAMRYCESISEAIAKNIAEVIIPLDSGCPYIFEKIKGTNKFDIVISNLKRYLSFEEPSEKRVILKYTILNGINDNQKELLDWFMLSRDLGIKKLTIDIDKKWYNQIRYSIPQYLKELIIFIKTMSKYNNVEIEFCDRTDFIYKSIKKKQ